MAFILSNNMRSSLGLPSNEEEQQARRRSSNTSNNQVNITNQPSNFQNIYGVGDVTRAGMLGVDIMGLVNSGEVSLTPDAAAMLERNLSKRAEDTNQRYQDAVAQGRVGPALQSQQDRWQNNQGMITGLGSAVKENKVNQMYNLAFGRDATDSEKQAWSTAIDVDTDVEEAANTLLQEAYAAHGETGNYTDWARQRLPQPVAVQQPTNANQPAQEPANNFVPWSQRPAEEIMAHAETLPENERLAFLVSADPWDQLATGDAEGFLQQIGAIAQFQQQGLLTTDAFSQEFDEAIKDYWGIGDTQAYTGSDIGGQAAQRTGVDENTFRNFLGELSALNSSFLGRERTPEEEQAYKNTFFRLTNKYGINPTPFKDGKQWFLDPGIDIDLYAAEGERTNLKGHFGDFGNLQRHAKTDGLSFPNEMSEIGPLVTAIAGSYLLGPALAAKLGGGMLGAAGAGAGLTAANQALWGQELDPQSIGYAALTSGALTGLDQFLNQGVLQPGAGLNNIDVSNASQSVRNVIDNVFGEGNIQLMNPSTGETVDAWKLTNNGAADLVLNQGWVEVTNTNVLNKLLDGLSKVPGVEQGATALAELLNPQYRPNQERPESVTYPSETFVDPTVDISTDPLTEKIMEEAFDSGQVTIEETPDGESVFVDVPPDFEPQEITQIGIPELPAPEGQGSGSGSGSGEGDSSEEVFVDADTETEEDIFVDTVTGEDTREDVFVDAPVEQEEVFADTPINPLDEVFPDTPRDDGVFDRPIEDEEIEPGLFDDPPEDEVFVNTPSPGGGGGGLRGLTMAGGSSDFDPFMSGLSYNPKMLAAINIELRDFLAELMRRG